MSSMLFFTSCSEEVTYDVVGSRENKVFLNTQLWSPVGVTNGVVFNITKTPLEVIIQDAEKIETKIVARCTKPAETDIRVQFAYDPSLVEEGYASLPQGVNLLMDRETLTIPRGATHSQDTLKLTPEGDLLHFEPGSYMASVTITSAGETDVDERRSASLVIKVEFNNIEQGASSLPGTAIERSGWSATLGTANADNLFDGNNSTYSSSSTLPLMLDVDMGSLKENITGIRLQNQSRYYAMSAANVYIRESELGDFQLQGSVTLSMPSNTSGYPQYIKFIGPVKARYIRLEILSFLYGTRYAARLSEFMPYQGE